MSIPDQSDTLGSLRTCGLQRKVVSSGAGRGGGSSEDTVSKALPGARLPRAPLPPALVWTGTSPAGLPLVLCRDVAALQREGSYAQSCPSTGWLHSGVAQGEKQRLLQFASSAWAFHLGLLVETTILPAWHLRSPLPASAAQENAFLSL